ncbi:MAG: hypothetical protein Q7T41_04015 [Candidatus Saccharibacteria bacterium]|nr:hypothetical protein [Candidatus Saccharibacteria bacterium]
MAPYHHHVNTHHRMKRATKLKKFAKLSVAFVSVLGLFIALDWVWTNVKSGQTVVSKDSSATVQAAQINIFKTPYYRFQADSSWREVTDELSQSTNTQSDFHQYLYRSFDKNFIEHELWVTVNMPESYQLARHNVPTRVIPVRVESDGSITQLDSVSGPCVEALPEGSTDVSPQIVLQKDVSYFCNPNQNNDYTVIAGIPSGTERLPVSVDSNQITITITYRNVTPIPESSMFERILSTFRAE